MTDLPPAFRFHVGGKIEMSGRFPLTGPDELSLVYTPGVADVSREIHRHPDAVWDWTRKSNSVAVVTDGTAVLGLGDIGPQAALPVMEGKAVLFKQFGGVDAWPICLDTKDPDEIVRAVKWIAPSFGGINLEDISAPRCFEIEERLKAELDIPVFHDDQHGTAVVVLAGLMNAAKLTGRDLATLRIVIAGAGAAGVACTRILKSVGVSDIIVCDRSGALHPGRDYGSNASKARLAAETNPRHIAGSLHDALAGADVFIGVSGPDIVTAEDLQAMSPNPIVFAMANPDPEVRPEIANQYATVVATGRSDYPNQINNVLCFPGLFKGALAVRASAINEPMKLAAASAISQCVSPDDLANGVIIPSVFNPNVADSVAAAVAQAARDTGVARLP